MPDPSHRQDSIDPVAAASYIADLSSDLALIARRHGLESLGFILDMARLEAEAVGRTPRGGQPIRGG